MAPTHVRRFAIISPNFHPRTCGVGDHSALLGQELQRRGHAVRIFSRNPVEPNPMASEVEAVGTSARRPLSIARGLWPSIQDWSPTDVIVQYTAQMWDAGRFGSAAVPWIAAKARASGARVTVIAHELFVGYAIRPDRMIGATMMRAQFAALLGTAHSFFVTTRSRLGYVEPYRRLLRRPAPGVLPVPPNAVPTPAKCPQGGARVGLFSSAAAGKRFDVVLDAFSRIVAVRPDAELILIGDLGDPTSPSVRQVLEAVHSHPAADRIRVTGRLELREVSAEIAKLDVYLFPMDTGANTRSGTLPVALGAGVPAVCIDGAETDHELFRGDETVVFASALTGAAFGDAARRLLTDAGLAEKVSHGARALYEEHLTWERVTDRLLEAIG